MTDFRYHSMRAEKARIGARVTKSVVIGLTIITIFLSIGGIVLTILGLTVGWLCIGLSVIPAMIIEWKKGELTNLVTVSPVVSVDDILAGDILGLLPLKPSPYDIATAIGQLYGGQFFAVRFGIGTKFLQEIASNNSDDTQVLWQKALDVQAELKSKEVSSPILLASIIALHPKHDSLLGHLQLSIEDIYEGVKWYDHIDDLIIKQQRHTRTGGIGRDWSFGWTPLLSRFGANISEQISAQGHMSISLEAHVDAKQQLIDMLSGKSHQNPVLVGQVGAGKTEVIYAFAQTLLDASSAVSHDLKFRQVFLLDASSMIAAASGKGEMESLTASLLNEARSADNVILCFDNAQLFFEEGVGSVDISNILLPVLEAGRLRIMMTMDEQKFLQITERNPAIANTLHRVTIAPASRSETLAVMQDQLLRIEFAHDVTYMYQALQKSFTLSERYMHDQAMPGRALKLLEAASGFTDDGLVSGYSVEQAIEQTMNIKVGVAQGNEERDKLLNLETLIHERMINQTKAVSVVSDALRRARAGVRNQDRPIGTFLFLGPTGVGKTELAKALADVYFEGEDHIIRLDMNEYVTSNDVSRLIADGAGNTTSLTAQIMKQPFSVILLDEIEKAHPSVLTTLLQLLDEGVLRDEKNREVSFRDAIVIATSNAGAESIREHIDRGMDIEQFQDVFIDELIKSNQFRPEFLNRFDEIVMFKPLGKDELVQVVDLIVKGINKTLEQQKISVTVSSDAKAYLVESGYDPRLGARPMRRVVQRAVENTIANKVLSGDVESGGTVEIGLDQVKKILGNKKHADAIAEGGQ